MATEIIDVVDSAVKIGLGALISGFSTYFVTKANSKNQQLKESKAIQREIISSISESADKFFEYTYTYFSILDGIINGSEKYEFSDSTWSQAKKNIMECESEYKVAMSNIYAAQSKLELLGLKEALKELNSYRSGLQELRSYVDINPDNFPDRQFQGQWCEKYLPYKKNFSELLSNEYLKLL